MIGEYDMSVGDYFSNIHKAMINIDKDDLHKVIEILELARDKGKRVYMVGNGGSSSTASHFAADLMKTSDREDKKRFRVVCLNDNTALLTAHTNDDGWDYAYVNQLRKRITEGDVLVVFSAHGCETNWSNNLIKAINYAKEQGATTIGFSGFTGGQVMEKSDICLVPIEKMESVPVIESLHVILSHYIAFAIRGDL